MSDHPFIYNLKMAQANTNAAINHLTEALAMTTARLLARKERHLLLTTRTNLRRYENILRSVVPTALEAIADHPTLPGFTVTQLQPPKKPETSPSPHKRLPRRSDQGSR